MGRAAPHEEKNAGLRAAKTRRSRLRQCRGAPLKQIWHGQPEQPQRARPQQLATSPSPGMELAFEIMSHGARAQYTPNPGKLDEKTGGGKRRFKRDSREGMRSVRRDA